MDVSLSTIDEEPVFPICRLCNDTLKESRVLPCMDIFCTDCLDKYIQDASNGTGINCPTCKAVFVIPIDGTGVAESPSTVRPLVGTIDMTSGNTCRFCDTPDAIASVYCVDCALPLCDTCLGQHSKIQGTSMHVLISVEKKGAHQTASFNGHYKGEPSLLACRASINGTGQNLSSDRSHGNRSLMSLRSSFADYQKGVHSLTRCANHYLHQLRNACEGMESLVCSHAEKLHHDIEGNKGKLIKEIRHTQMKDETTVKKHLADFKKSEIYLNKTNEFLENVMTYTTEVELADISKVLQHHKDLTNEHGHHHLGVDTWDIGFPHDHDDHHSHSTKLETVPENDVNDDTDAYKVRDYRDSITLGKLKLDGTKPMDATGPSKTKHKHDKTRARQEKCVTSFKADESLMGLTSTIDDTIVVTSYTTKKCSIYTLKGEHVQDITKNVVQPITVLSMMTGKLLVADSGDFSHKMAFNMYYTDGELFPCSFNIPDSPWGMAETGHGDIVICHPEKHRVCIYDRKGRMKMTLKSPDGTSLFSNPRCACVNINGDIVVSDFGRHAVLFFDSEGQYKFSYGKEGKRSGQLHHPCGVCSDSRGNIIIADSDNHRVHLLSMDGKFVRFLVNKHDGLLEPVAVCLTKEEKLVIGEWSGKITIWEYY